MMWFVYVEETFYPYAKVVEAETREAAIDRLYPGEEPPDDMVFYVVPYDADAAIGQRSAIDLWQSL